jgi:hypothetical protein
MGLVLPIRLGVDWTRTFNERKFGSIKLNKGFAPNKSADLALSFKKKSPPQVLLYRIAFERETGS